MRLLCLLGWHKWRDMKWGDGAPGSGGELDCRECSRCHRFEVWSYGAFKRARRADFLDAV